MELCYASTPFFSLFSLIVCRSNVCFSHASLSKAFCGVVVLPASDAIVVGARGKEGPSALPFSGTAGKVGYEMCACATRMRSFHLPLIPQPTERNEATEGRDDTQTEERDRTEDASTAIRQKKRIVERRLQMMI